jgi:hypothetical protein
MLPVWGVHRQDAYAPSDVSHFALSQFINYDRADNGFIFRLLRVSG